MIKINEKEIDMAYEEREASYGVLKNNEGKIAVVEVDRWGLIFPGGKTEEGEDPACTISRETLEETGYSVTNLEYFDTTDSCYQVTVRGKTINCHSIANFYVGDITDKVKDSEESDKTLKWFNISELKGKMKLDFQNVILERLYGDAINE